MSNIHVITKMSHIDLLSSFIQGCHFLLNIYQVHSINDGNVFNFSGKKDKSEDS